MAKREIDKRIKSYLTKKNETKYMFYIYAGVDPMTGKKRKVKKMGFKTALEADRALRRIETQVKNEGADSVKVKQSKKFLEIYNLWFENYKKTVKESTWASTEEIFRLHILPVFGENFINKIDVFFCQKAVNEWSEQYPKTFKKYKNYTSNVFDYAVSIQETESNPMKIVTVPKGEILSIEKKDIEFYTKDELLEFLNAAKQEKDTIYIFFYLLAYTGLRKGEAFALTWSDINLNTNTLTVNKTITRGKNGRLIVNEPKTKNGVRTIYLDHELSNALKKYKKSSNKLTHIFDSANLVFSNNGELYNPTITRFWLKQIYKKNEKLKRISAHGFRHTHASLLFESGASLKDAQAILGHADIQTTANIYTHVTENKNKTTISNFSNYMKGRMG
ncbi:tyrosine-type recombinase/integrase [Enterococcus durans]|uniref:tyrosine-type recombinase/integrase n=1 Tax=Enterococcus durans TaxID=53345 RepID=UPI003BEF0ACD